MSKIVVFDHDGTLVNTHGSHKFLFEGIKELLLNLKKEGLELFVWTSRSRGSTIEILKSLGIIGAFSDIYCGNDAHPKPSVLGLKELLGEVSAQKVVVVGDSYADVLGAKNFGAYAVAALWDELANEAYLKECGADEFVQSPAELFMSIKNYFKNKE